MIDFIYKNTAAFIKKLEVDDALTEQLINISDYKFSIYQSYLVYLICENKIRYSSEKLLDQNKNFVLTPNELKHINHYDTYMVVVPLNNKFASDFAKIESKVIDFNAIENGMKKTFKKLFLYIHFSLPLLGMLYLSSAITSYSLYFDVPIDMLDIASQVNILYKLILSLIVGLFEFFFTPKVFVITIIVFFLFALFLSSYIDVFFKRKLYKFIKKSPKYLLSLFILVEKNISLILIQSYLILLISIISVFASFISDVLLHVNDLNNTTTTTQERASKLMHSQPNIFFYSLLNYSQLTTFPQYLKLQSGQYVVVKAVKDDLIYYNTFENVFENLLSSENSNAVHKRLCKKEQVKELYPKILDGNKSYEYDLLVGLKVPKSNIAPTSILVNSTNGIDEFYNRADKLKQEICK